MINFLYSAQIIMPIVILIIIGYLLQKLKLFNSQFLEVANRLAFKVFLPILLFYNVFSQPKITEYFNLRLILFVFSMTIFLWLILMIVMKSFVKEQKRVGVMIQGIFRSNFLLFGLPLAGIYDVTTVAIFAACYIPLINILANLTLYKFSEDQNKSLKLALQSSITNPLFIGGILGLTLGIVRELIGFDIPVILAIPLSQIRDLATPFAFILLGAELKIRTMFTNFRYTLSASIIKTIGYPMIFLPLAYFLNFNKLEFAIVLAVSATPNAVSSYTMARNYNSDYKLAGEMVVLSTLISIVTLFIILTISIHLGLINQP